MEGPVHCGVLGAEGIALSVSSTGGDPEGTGTVRCITRGGNPIG